MNRYVAREVGRHAFRCLDCLGVLFLEGVPGGAIDVGCPHCEGRLDWMGKVGPKHVWKQVGACPCDERCTHAQGPSCECSCGGANHGIGHVWAPVVVGDVARLESSVSRADSGRLRARAEEWRELVVRANAVWADRFGTLVAERRKGYRLTDLQYERYHRARGFEGDLAEICFSVSTGRNKKLTRIIEEMQHA